MIETQAQPAQDTPKAAQQTIVTAKPAEATAQAQPTPTETKTDVKPDVKPETKPEEGKPVVPEKYDLKLPKDSTLDAAYVEKLALEAKEKGLTNEQAQAMLERDSQTKASFEQGQRELLKAKTEEWYKASEADPEIGGKSFKESAELARRALDRFATDNLKKALDDTGLGNHPELVRVFAKIGRAMGNDQLVVPGGQTASDNRKSPEEMLYGKK